MIKFRPLDWLPEEDGTMFANTNGLRWMYYITPLKASKVELAFLDDNGNCNHHFTHHNTIAEAQDKANRHYFATLKQLTI